MVFNLKSTIAYTSLTIILFSIITLYLIKPINKSVIAEQNRKEVIYFGYDDYSLSGESKVKLDEILKKLKRLIEYRLTVAGYTDKKGNPEYNRRLSAKRIESVVNYLKTNGINENRIKTFNHGSAESSSGDEEKSLRLNRRVELSITESGLNKGTVSETDSYNTDSESNPVGTIQTKSIIQHELRKIASTNITFKVPSEILEHESEKVEVLVSDNFISELSKKLKNNTYKIFENISNIELNGLRLFANDIQIITITENDSGRWEWHVIPKQEGIHTISLIMSLKFTESTGTQDLISIPIMLKAVNIINRPFYLVSEILRKGLYLIFILITALGIFTMISKKYQSNNIRKSI